ncbi:MAG: PilZ domain protein [Gemmataceae bacterium]|nr:PilZ domain protein [Gemmataceae bacterium]
MLVAQYLEVIRTFVGENLSVVTGGAVAIFVLSMLFFRQRRRGGGLALDAATLAVPSSARAVDEDKAVNWAPPEQSYADRRGAVRRDGVPVRVVLSSTSFRNGVNDGFVVDRSTGGLRILMQSAMAPGSTLQVKAVNAPDTVGFVTVIVRSCRKHADHFEVGCEFEKTPPWNVLLLFG